MVSATAARARPWGSALLAWRDRCGPAGGRAGARDGPHPPTAGGVRDCCAGAALGGRPCRRGRTSAGRREGERELMTARARTRREGDVSGGVRPQRPAITPVTARATARRTEDGHHPARPRPTLHGRRDPSHEAPAGAAAGRGPPPSTDPPHGAPARPPTAPRHAQEAAPAQAAARHPARTRRPAPRHARDAVRHPARTPLHGAPTPTRHRAPARSGSRTRPGRRTAPGTDPPPRVPARPESLTRPSRRTAPDKPPRSPARRRRRTATHPTPPPSG